MVERIMGLTQRLIPRVLPKPASRYPADPRAVFILGLCVVVGLPLLFIGAEPGSLQALMPRWFIAGWGFFLVFGAGGSLWGMSKQTANGILAEQVGSVAVGGASLVYGAAIVLYGFISDDPGVGFSSIIVFGWAFSCFWRWLQLYALVASGITLKDHEDGACAC